MYVYEIRSYDDIYSITQHFLTMKQIGDKDFSKIFNFFISTLIWRILSSALKLQLPKVNYINQVSVFYINGKRKIVETFAALQKIFTKALEIIALKFLKLIKRDIYENIIDNFFTYTLNTYTTII